MEKSGAAIKADQWFSLWSDFASRGTSAISGDIFGCHNWYGGSHIGTGSTGIYG